MLGEGFQRAAMHAQHAKNYDFFGAPVGLIFTVDRVMRQGSWLDYGMFLQNIMVAARARGLDTCPQAAFTQWHRIIAAQLQLPDSEMVVCGMALGYAVPEAPENQLLTERAPDSLTFAIAATLEFPVASIGSRTIASRSARSAGSLT